jgi:hypothetical protein
VKLVYPRGEVSKDELAELRRGFSFATASKLTIILFFVLRCLPTPATIAPLESPCTGANRRSSDMKRFALAAVLGLAAAVTVLSPAAAAHHRPHYVFARLGAGVCDGLVCSGAFFATPYDACGAVVVPVTTRYVRLVSQSVCPGGLGVSMYQMVR